MASKRRKYRNSKITKEIENLENIEISDNGKNVNVFYFYDQKFLACKKFYDLKNSCKYRNYEL